MRSLVVVQPLPWPVRSGNAMRVTSVVSALASLGEVEVYALADPLQPDPPELPSDLPVGRVASVPRPPIRHPLLHRVRWVIRPSLPIELEGRDYGPARERFEAWAAPAYDLVWFSRAETWLALGGCARGPAIVDLDDLEDVKILTRLAIEDLDLVVATGVVATGVVARTRRVLARLQGERNAGRWQQLQHGAAAAVAAAAVCSEKDARRLGSPNAVVVPNGYERPARPLGRSAVGHPPVVLFVGMLAYPPNADAAHFLVQEIGPALRALVPDVRIRLVGRLGDRLRAALEDGPQVVCPGFVPQLADELARADLIAVPIRYGGGTRIKILEAFAHRIPVVSTTIGAEGLCVEGGRHLRLADTPEEFAAACAELLRDDKGRSALVEEAHALYLRQYEGSIVRQVIGSTAADVAAGAGSST